MKLLSVLVIMFLASANVKGAETITVELDVREAQWEIKPGLTTNVWSYNGTVPGKAILAREGDTIIVNGVNHLPGVTTNIHWHGLRVPNDQDGPARNIKPGESFEYRFTLRDTGTYWYHPHYRPVMEQTDMGMYAPFIIKTPEDDKYTSDHFFMFDDWFLDADGKRLPGTGRGDMERYGTLETVNGKSGEAIPAVKVAVGELHKFRLMSASTAVPHTIRIEGHMLRVTHTDGRLLPEPYVTDSVTLHPAERYDVEFEALGSPGTTYYLVSERPEMGIKMPIIYSMETVAPVPSPIDSTPSRAYPNVETKKVDHVLTLNSRMKMGMGMMSDMRGSMSGHDMGAMESGGHGAAMEKSPAEQMEYTINGEVFPNVPPIVIKAGQLTKLRFVNEDTKGMHAMDHPIHLHGSFFQVVSLNGEKPPRETFKDTINVPPGQYVDIAFSIDEPGDWMLHCHILDHEDGGMMMVVRVVE